MNRPRGSMPSADLRCMVLMAAVVVLECVCHVGLAESAAVDRDQEVRAEMTTRGLSFLVSIQRVDGSLGDTRPKAVTSLFILACLAAGHGPDDPAFGPPLRKAADWILINSPQSFLGGGENPNEDHALAATALFELAGADSDAARNLAIYRKARGALDVSLELQDKQPNPATGGGWRPDDRTRTNDRLLSSWFLLHLFGARLRDEPVPKGSFDRAAAFVTHSQNTAGTGDGRGGFSVDAAGLPVRSVTAAGAWVLVVQGDPAAAERLALARQWLAAHPPRWQGPHFYETNFFAVRALAGSRPAPDDGVFSGYFARLVRLLRERQEADGGFPFPPGHAQGRLAMGRGYTTALAILALNADRGVLPLDAMSSVGGEAGGSVTAVRR